MRVNHSAAATGHSESEPTRRKRPATVWHQHQKKFAKTEGMHDNSQIVHSVMITFINWLCIKDGKAAMQTAGTAMFNKLAKEAYHKLTEDEKQELKSATVAPIEEVITRKGLARDSKRLFLQIQKIVRFLHTIV